MDGEKERGERRMEERIKDMERKMEMREKREKKMLLYEE